MKRSRLNMSLEANNLKAKNSFRYSGVVKKQTVGVEPAKDGKGVVLVTRKSKGSRMPGKNDSPGAEARPPCHHGYHPGLTQGQQLQTGSDQLCLQEILCHPQV